MHNNKLIKEENSLTKKEKLTIKHHGNTKKKNMRKEC